MDKSQLLDRIDELSIIVREIETSNAWRLAMKEIGSLIEQLDDNWQSLTPETFQEAQTRKLGLMSVLSLVEDWAYELDDLKEQHQRLEHPDKFQEGDYDTEGIDPSETNYEEVNNVGE